MDYLIDGLAGRLTDISTRKKAVEKADALNAVSIIEFYSAGEILPRTLRFCPQARAFKNGRGIGFGSRLRPTMTRLSPFPVSPDT